MKVGFRDDLVFSLVLCAPLFFYAGLAANPLYLGSWYVILVPAAMLVVGLLLRTPALFLTGTTTAAISSLLMYITIMAHMENVEGLFGLGHLCSVPGMFIGTVLSAFLLRYRLKTRLPVIVGGIAFLGAALGFFIAQAVVCNTVMYCGALSLGFD